VEEEEEEGEGLVGEEEEEVGEGFVGEEEEGEVLSEEEGDRDCPEEGERDSGVSQGRNRQAFMPSPSTSPSMPPSPSLSGVSCAMVWMCIVVSW